MSDKWYLSGPLGIGTAEPSESLQVDGSIYIQGEGCGLIIDEKKNGKRVGFLKYFGREAGIWRIANQDFEIGRRLDVSSLPGSTSPDPTKMVTDLYISGNGNVGIGISDPKVKLDINGDMRANKFCGLNTLGLNDYQTPNPSSNVYLYSPGNDRDSWLFLDSADTGSNWGIYHRQIDTGVKGLPANSIGFIGNSDLKAYVSLSDGSAYFKGNVGIGTPNPNRKLDVAGDLRASGEIQTSWGEFRMVQGEFGSILKNDGAQTYILLTNRGDQYGAFNQLLPISINNSCGDVHLGNRSLSVKASSGRVGIGTIDPRATLDVAGDLSIHSTHTTEGRIIGDDPHGGTVRLSANQGSNNIWFKWTNDGFEIWVDISRIRTIKWSEDPL